MSSRRHMTCCIQWAGSAGSAVVDPCQGKPPHGRVAPLTGFALLMQVLSNPQKRDIYDVYGKEGLTAGLQVHTHDLPHASVL